MVEDEDNYSTEDTQFEGDDVEDDLAIPISKDQRNIRTKSVDPEINSLYEKWKRGKLILQPDFQRHFVWDSKKSSRLIESALLSLPLPVIYLAEEQDGREYVIDGQQRLTSFFSFLDNRFPDGKPFRLTGLEIFPELNHMAFSDLDERFQDKIRYYEVRTITLLNDSDQDLKFAIFERLNTGSVPLNDMELRNCVYRGQYVNLLKELAEYPTFRSLIGVKDASKRMRDVELVLRFAAFYHATYLKYQPPVRRFLNRDMEKFRFITKEDADELKEAFKNSVQIIHSLFGDSAFRRFYRGDSKDPNGKWEAKKFNASLYDVLMGTLCNIEKNKAYASLDALREGLIDLMASNEEFIDAILIGTSSQDKVRTRFDLTRKIVDDILKYCNSQPRCFTFTLKQELFESDPTCAICNQRIQAIDDAAIDHIEQYWLGGKTNLENARLTHRYCNNARPRKE
jgi:hypothetical protein